MSCQYKNHETLWALWIAALRHPVRTGRGRQSPLPLLGKVLDLTREVMELCFDRHGSSRGHHFFWKRVNATSFVMPQSEIGSAQIGT